MNSIAGAMAAAAGDSNTLTKRKNVLTQEDFLNLFIKQLQYQNPLSPMDNAQMATQIAQFNQVEALNTLVKSFRNLESYQASINGLYTVGLIGKKVEATGNTLGIEQGKVSEGYYQLAKPGRVNIHVFDANSVLVRVIPAGFKDGAKQTFIWDGRNQHGVSLPDGVYSFAVVAMDERNQPIQVKTSRAGLVTGIAFDGGITYLQMGKDRIPVSEILSIVS